MDTLKVYLKDVQYIVGNKTFVQLLMEKTSSRNYSKSLFSMVLGKMAAYFVCFLKYTRICLWP